MTPLRRCGGGRPSLLESDEELLDKFSEDQTVMMDDCMSPPSLPGSPLLGGGRPSRSSLSSSKSTGSSSSSSASMTSSSAAPRPPSRLLLSSTRHHHSKAKGNPESRRLFDEGFDADGADLLDRTADAAATGFEDLKLSPPRALRPTLRPLDLNHEEPGGSAAGGGGPLSAAPTPFPTSRKRPAAEVRGTAGAFLWLPHGGGVAAASSSMNKAMIAAAASSGHRTNGAAGPGGSMHHSPHLSPNSFLTMDGRFVQSKNPFSSPMMTEDHEASLYGAAGASSSASVANAPSMPVVFGNNLAPEGTHHLPPRHKHRGSLFPAYGTDGFQKKVFFTGSPIREDEAMEDASHVNHFGVGGAHHPSSTTSAGSLTKVRRFQLSDDIVAASGQEFTSYKRALAVDTTANHNPSDMFVSHDPSPTDILSFPTPPTPVKARPRSKDSGHFYNMIRRQEPGTPSIHRHGNYDGVDSKTPHPGRAPHNRRGPSFFSGAASASTASEPSAGVSSSRFTTDFDVIGELGKGSFGCVYKVLSRLDGCMYAIKTAKRQAKGVADRDRMLKEVYALAALSDQADTATFHIVRYHQAWMEDDRLYIQTELCSGTLAEEIAVGPMAEPRRFKVLREILLALDFIHRQHMVHLDIKPENIFLKNDQWKLGDFGLVTRASSNQEVEEGDSRYMSMELLAGDRSDLTKSDVFSLGATLYEICLHRPLPMNGPEWQDIRSGRLVNPMPNTSLDLSHLISQMMNPVSSSRPSAGQLLLHPQLLSDEQKALNLEKNRVLALQQLAQSQQRFPPPTLPPRRGLMRSNTWNGSSVNSYL